MQLLREVRLSSGRWQVGIPRPDILCCLQAPAASVKKTRRKGQSVRYATFKAVPDKSKGISQKPQETTEDTTDSSQVALRAAGQLSKSVRQVSAMKRPFLKTLCPPLAPPPQASPSLAIPVTSLFSQPHTVFLNSSSVIGSA